MGDPKPLKPPKTPRPPGAPPAMKTEVPGDRKPDNPEAIPDSQKRNINTVMEPSSQTQSLTAKAFQDQMSKEGDQVVKPNHYQSKDGKFQVWDIVDQFNLNYYFGDAVKYICRAGKKSISHEKQDIRKAIQYLQRWLDTQETK